MAVGGVQYFQNAATANGNGTPVDLEYYGGSEKVLIEVVETAGGTATVTFEGAFDGTAAANWYVLGFQLIDNTAAPARSVTAVSVTANMKHVYQLLDVYPQVRARISSIAAGGTVTVRSYATPG